LLFSAETENFKCFFDSANYEDLRSSERGEKGRAIGIKEGGEDRRVRIESDTAAQMSHASLLARLTGVPKDCLQRLEREEEEE